MWLSTLMQHLKGYCDHSCYRSFIYRSEDYNWPPTNFSRTTSMVETTPIVTGGVLCGGLRTCQHRHTLLSIFTLHASCFVPPFLTLVCLFLYRLFLSLHLSIFNVFPFLSFLSSQEGSSHTKRPRHKHFPFSNTVWRLTLFSVMRVLDLLAVP